MNIKEVRNFVEEKTQLDIGKKSRRRNYVYARAVFFYLARKYAGSTYYVMAAEINCNHASVIYSIKNTIPVIFKEEPKLKVLCEKFVSLFKEEIISDTKTRKDIISENIDLKIRLSRYEDAEAKDNKTQVIQNTIDSRFAKLIQQTPEDKLDNLYVKMDAIVKMLNSKWKDKIDVYSSYETVNGY
tara:strand:+ start:36 stop:590 length:555 start_codon:yes stop_codon:yes gene_type:complete